MNVENEYKSVFLGYTKFDFHVGNFQYQMDLLFGRSTGFLFQPVTRLYLQQTVSSVRGTLVRWCFLCEMAALQAEPSDWFHTADWTTNTLWTLVRDSRCNCGLDTVMSAIFHHWASSYCDMTAALTLPPEQDSPLAQTLVGEGVEKTLCATG